MAPLRTGVQGWLNLFAIFLTNYGFHLSRGHASSSQEADYVGVSEAAGLQSLQSVTYTLESIVGEVWMLFQGETGTV